MKFGWAVIGFWLSFLATVGHAQDVQDFVGLRLAAVEKFAVESSIELRVEKIDSEQPIGTVLRQAPGGGGAVGADQRFTVWVSDGLVIPTFRGQPEHQALKDAEDAGFTANIFYRMPTHDSINPETGTFYQAGEVFHTIPTEGYRLDPGFEALILIVATETLTTVPSIAGQSVEAARDILAQQNLSIEIPFLHPRTRGVCFYREYTNIVSGSQPTAGAVVPINSKVRIGREFNEITLADEQCQ